MFNNLNIYIFLFLINKQALGFDPKVDNYVSNTIGIFGGFYLLYFTERVLKIALKADPEVRVQLHLDSKQVIRRRVRAHCAFYFCLCAALPQLPVTTD